MFVCRLGHRLWFAVERYGLVFAPKEFSLGTLTPRYKVAMLVLSGGETTEGLVLLGFLEAEAIVVRTYGRLGTETVRELDVRQAASDNH